MTSSSQARRVGALMVDHDYVLTVANELGNVLLHRTIQAKKTVISQNCVAAVAVNGLLIEPSGRSRPTELVASPARALASRNIR